MRVCSSRLWGGGRMLWSPLAIRDAGALESRPAGSVRAPMQSERRPATGRDRRLQVRVSVFAVVLAVAALTLVSCQADPGAGSAAGRGGGSGQGYGSIGAARAGTVAVVSAPLPGTTASYLGVFEIGAPSSVTPVHTFAATVGRWPNIVLYYSGWNEAFQSRFAAAVRARGGTVLVDLAPTGVSLWSVAQGQRDAFLNSYAHEVRSYGHPVIISFAGEMNGSWYPYGWTHTSPALWVRAWRHIVTLFRRDGATNVTWMWTVNRMTRGEGPIADWWPGASYVNWTGIDGYVYYRSDTFAGIFGPTISAIRRLTHEPIFIAETAVGQVAGQAAKIPMLFAGVKDYRLLGLLWFDVAQEGSIFKQNWRLEGHPAAVAAFRRAVTHYLK